MKENPLLSITGLTVVYRSKKGELRAVEDVSFEIDRGEVVALVGESGSGKSTIGLSIMGLLPPSAKMLGGSIRFEGKELAGKPRDMLRRLMGSKIAMVFQEPVSYLNPVLKIGDQVAESILLHNDVTKDEAKSRALEMLRRVRIPDPARVYNYYPHQLSGGMAQRVCIAIAISNNPALLIADEPTTSLDLTIQAQILHLLKNLCGELNMAMLLISHDLRVVSGMADRVITLYAGKIAEERNVADIFSQPMHPYTRLLMKSSGINNQTDEGYQTAGGLPDLHNPPMGCRFMSRCLHAFERCRLDPKEVRFGENSRVYCWLYEESVK
ncbi:MAG: ABC transporter ATP-binding protein [Conexivisphaerales archaeon]